MKITITKPGLSTTLSDVKTGEVFRFAGSLRGEGPTLRTNLPLEQMGSTVRLDKGFATHGGAALAVEILGVIAWHED